MYSVMSVSQRGGVFLSLWTGPCPFVPPLCTAPPLTTDMYCELWDRRAVGIQLKSLLVDVDVIVYYHITICNWLLPLTTYQQQIINCLFLPKLKLTKADLSWFVTNQFSDSTEEIRIPLLAMFAHSVVQSSARTLILFTRKPISNKEATFDDDC